MSAIVDRMRAVAVERVLQGAGTASADARRAAFDNAASAPPLVTKVCAHAWQVTAEDIAAAKAAGLTEDQIFELVVCASIGQATRQLDAALAVLEDA